MNKQWKNPDDLLYPQDSNSDANAMLPEDYSAGDYLDFVSNDMTDNERISNQEYYEDFLDED